MQKNKVGMWGFDPTPSRSDKNDLRKKRIKENEVEGVRSHILLVPNGRKIKKLRENEEKALGIDLGFQSRMDQTKTNKNVSVVQGIRNRVPIPNFRGDT